MKRTAWHPIPSRADSSSKQKPGTNTPHGDWRKRTRDSGDMEQTSGPLVQVCRLLNAQKAEYLVVGGWAMVLNSVVRATEDVDILVADNRENYRKVIA
ncbi:MAG: hypothetical protein WCS65_04020 [Verrucomicrobiae bacterium]